MSELLAEEKLMGLPVLIFANKQDLPNAMTAAEITDKLGLNQLRGRKVKYFKFTNQKILFK